VQNAPYLLSFGIAPNVRIAIRKRPLASVASHGSSCPISAIDQRRRTYRRKVVKADILSTSRKGPKALV
jgi:hypothetical protein